MATNDKNVYQSKGLGNNIILYNSNLDNPETTLIKFNRKGTKLENNKEKFETEMRVKTYKKPVDYVLAKNT